MFCWFADSCCRWVDSGARSLRAIAARLLWTREGAVIFRTADDARRFSQRDDGQHLALLEFQDSWDACSKHARHHPRAVGWHADLPVLAVRPPRDRGRRHPARIALAYFLARGGRKSRSQQARSQACGPILATKRHKSTK